MDDIEYLDPYSINGLNLYCYCLNNPIMYVDPDGYFPWIVALVLVVCIISVIVLDGHSENKAESQITELNLNINDENPFGDIKVTIDYESIRIDDSYKIQNEKDMEKIINIIMSNHYYKFYGYNRTQRSYLSEWKAHNAAYSVYHKGNWGRRTGSVDFNKNLKEDNHRFVYWIFFD